MKKLCLLPLLCVALLLGCQTPSSDSSKSVAPATAPKATAPWLGVHVFLRNDEMVAALEKELPNFAALGVNTLIVEVNYCFDFKSHPEVRDQPMIHAANAHALAKLARKHGIRLIPELDCLGHQSWRKADAGLLRAYPEFKEPADDKTDPNGAHLHSWCPHHPDVHPLIFDLMDELVAAFETDAFHVGMDEVFTIASDNCPRCQGKTPADVYAYTVTSLHEHIVKKRGWEMLMWGDRLLDAKTLGYSKWEASKNGTHGAADLIPKDIVVCDWHYEKQTNYPSIPYLLDKGFRVWPTGWQPLEAAQALSRYSQSQTNPLVVGYLASVWGKAKIPQVPTWPPVVEVMKEWQPKGKKGE